MTEFRRLISYIYEYEGKVKGKNVGFAKLETRNGLCKLNISVKKLYMGSGNLGVYLLSARKEIFLGNMCLRNGNGEFRTVVQASDIEQSGETMDDCYGLTIHEKKDSWKVYTTIWEDTVAQAAQLAAGTAVLENGENLENRETTVSAEENTYHSNTINQLQKASADQSMQENLSGLAVMERETPGQETIQQKLPSQENMQQKPLNQENMRQKLLNQESTQQKLPSQETIQQELFSQENRQQEAREQESMQQALYSQGHTQPSLNNQESVQQGAGIQEASQQTPDIQALTQSNPGSEKLSCVKAGQQDINKQESNRQEITQSATGNQEPVLQEAGKQQSPRQEEAQKGPMASVQNQPGGKIIQKEGLFREEKKSQSPVSNRVYGNRMNNHPPRRAQSQMFFNLRQPFNALPQNQGVPAASSFSPAQTPAPSNPATLAAAPQSDTPVSFNVSIPTDNQNQQPLIRQYEEEPLIPGDPEALARLEEEEKVPAVPIWDFLSKTYPKIQAFESQFGCEILVIKPQDIGLLPRETWIYGNNSFLLHGYYNYRYLILARLENPHGIPRHLLGVPGHYYNNEKYMASMFGFPNFVLSKNQQAQDGRFGYWYTDIRLGDGNIASAVVRHAQRGIE